MKLNQADITSAVKAAIAGNPALQKDWLAPNSAVSGINYYDLEAPAKQLYPVITPLRNRIPRVKATGGIQANWRAVTAINVNGTRAGVGQGNRGGAIQTTTKDYTAAYKSIGLEDFVTFEADLAAEGFQDVKALAVEGLLRALMIQEEAIILGGNNSLALGRTATPSLVGSTTGGTLATMTISVICVGLTLDGYQNASIAAGIQGQVTRTNTDSSQDVFGGGSARQSVAATASITGATGSCAATVAAQVGAVAYAWYWGLAGSEALGAITTINSVSITANATGTQLASAIPNAGADNSQNSLVFDGLLPMCANSSYGGYVVTQATGTAGTGTPLTADTFGGIKEIDAVLKYMWDTYRLSPTDIYVNSQEMNNISAKILASNSANAQRFMFSAEQGVLAGGVMVRSYMNKYAMNGAVEIPIHLHPTLPAGTILFFTDKLPYPLSNVAQVLRVLTQREYYQIEWPLRSRKYEYGVYAREVLQNYFPPAFAIITNIGNG